MEVAVHREPVGHTGCGSHILEPSRTVSLGAVPLPAPAAGGVGVGAL